MGRKFKSIRLILICLCLAVALFSSIYLIQWAQESVHSSKTQQQLENLYNDSSQQEDSSGTSDILPEYRQLYEENKDIVGWLNIGSGLFSTPIMQKDNQYYLSHDFYGKENEHGQIFIDEKNSSDFTDDNTIIYGHNIPSDHSMFNILTNFKNPEFVKEHPTIEVNSLHKKQSYAVAGVYLVSTRPEHGEVFDYINYLNFANETARTYYLGQIHDRSLLDTGVKIGAEDQLVTLSTCTYEFSDARLVVVARKLREGESSSDFGKEVTKRENPLMPEIWTELYG